MHCNQCQNELPESAKFCPTCGVKIITAPFATLPARPEKVWNRRLVLGFVGWLFVYALVASYYAYGPWLITFPAQLLTMLAIYVGIFCVACFGGLIYKMCGKAMPWGRIVNSTLIFSFLLGGLFIYGLRYSAESYERRHRQSSSEAAVTVASVKTTLNTPLVA